MPTPPKNSPQPANKGAIPPQNTTNTQLHNLALLFDALERRKQKWQTIFQQMQNNYDSSASLFKQVMGGGGSNDAFDVVTGMTFAAIGALPGIGTAVSVLSVPLLYGVRQLMDDSVSTDFAQPMLKPSNGISRIIGEFTDKIEDDLESLRYGLNNGRITKSPAELDKYIGIMLLSPIWWPPKIYSHTTVANQQLSMQAAFDLYFALHWCKQIVSTTSNPLVRGVMAALLTKYLDVIFERNRVLRWALTDLLKGLPYSVLWRGDVLSEIPKSSLIVIGKMAEYADNNPLKFPYPFLPQVQQFLDYIGASSWSRSLNSAMFFAGNFDPKPRLTLDNFFKPK